MGATPEPDTAATDLAPGHVAVRVGTQAPRRSQGKKAAKLVPAKLRRSARIAARLAAESQPAAEVEVEQVKAQADDPQASAAEANAVDGQDAKTQGDEERLIIGILQKRIGKKDKPLYLVRWEGDYPSSWEPEENFPEDAIRDFETNGPCGAPSQASSEEDEEESEEAAAGPKRGKGRPSGKQPKATQ